jgi:uncharacterized cupin superfamily protein
MVKPVRRIIAGVGGNGKAAVLSDGPCPDVRFDPARPGFASTRLWVTDSTPAKVKGIRETLQLPHSLEAPNGGTVCRFIEFPPESTYIGKIGPAEVGAYFAAMGSPGVSTAHRGSPHPYMQRTRTIDFCYVLDGEITLVLDTQEVHLQEGDTVIQRGTNHAWSNRSDKPCRILMSQHDGTWDRRAIGPAAPIEPKESVARQSRPVRRVVTGRDQEGRSGVSYDSDAPNKVFMATGSTFNEAWTIESMPAPLDSTIDFGAAGRPMSLSPPSHGAHWRIAHSPAQQIDPKSLSAEEKKRLDAMQATGGTERREGGRHWMMHRTPTIDYAVCLEGERDLILEDTDVVLSKGDVVIQLGNWHSWANRSGEPGLMSYVMIGGEFG